MLIDNETFYLKELLKYSVIDSEGSEVGNVNDIVLTTDDMSIDKLVLSQDLYEFKSAICNISDINGVDIDKKQFNISCKREEVQEVKYQDFWDYVESKDMILFSRLIKLPIFDVDYQEHPGKVVDIIARGAKGKNNPRFLTLEGEFIVSKDFIRSITNKEVTLTIPGGFIENIRKIPEESFESLFSVPEQEIDTLDIGNPDWLKINNMIVLGHLELVEQLLEKWQVSDELPEKEKPALNYHLGKACLDMGEVDKAIKLMRTVIEAEKIQASDELLLGRAYTQLGSCLVTTGRLEEALTVLEKAVNVLGDIKFSVYRSIALNWIARVYYLLGKRENALQVSEQSLKLSELFNSPKTLAYTMENLAKIYRDEGQLEDALEMFQIARMGLKGNYPRTLASVMKNEAIIYYEMGMLGKAIEIHFDGLVIREKFRNPIDLADSVLNIARVEATMGSLNQSSKIFDYFPPGPYKRSILKAYRCFIDGLLAKVERNWDLAIKNFKQALCPNLDFTYQVWVYEYICVLLIMKWREDPGEEALAELKYRLSTARTLTIKNNLYSAKCKTDILLALLSLYMEEYSDSEKYYREALFHAKKYGLRVHEQIITKGLKSLTTITGKMNNTTKPFDYEQKEFIKQKTVMEMLLYGEHLRNYHLF